jgi:cyclophilin family peptidyl-prolyl cis-trans isomerase
MKLSHRLCLPILLAIPQLPAIAPPAAAGPMVRLDTVMGNIDLELLHEEAPLTVTNFLNYVVTDRYDDSFFHRSVPGFVVQGGGFTFPDGATFPVEVQTDAPVLNEFGVSNTRGTVAMAKLGGNPNSATSQFFFNLTDNSDLDNQNGGFTVFARVVGNGMTVADDISELRRVNLGGAFNTMPVRNLMGNTIEKEHLILVNDVLVLPGGVEGDYNANGRVEQGDLDLVLLNWGEDAAPLPAGWFQDLPSGTVDQSELDGVLLNWGSAAASAAPLASTSVPEPATWFLAALAVLVGIASEVVGEKGSRLFACRERAWSAVP